MKSERDIEIVERDESDYNKSQSDDVKKCGKVMAEAAVTGATATEKIIIDPSSTTASPNKKNFKQFKIIMTKTSAKENCSTKYSVAASEKINSRTRTFCDCFSEYSANTSIHGVRYLGEPDRPIWERIIWMGVFIISLYCCSRMMYNLYQKWNDTPIIVIFDEKQTEIWKIPFPAITICPQMKTDKNLFNFEKVVQKMQIENLTENEEKSLRTLFNVCEYFDLMKINSSKDCQKDEMDIFNILENLAPETVAIFRSIRERNALTPVFTEEGICYNFNGLKLEDLYSDEIKIPDFRVSQFLNFSSEKINNSNWNREKGYDKRSGIYAYPRRILGAGLKLGINVLVENTKKDIDHKCMLPGDGYRVVIHAPDNVPLTSSKFIHLPANHHMVVAVKPNMMWTSKELKSYSPKRRGCYFSNERILHFFKVYTEVNCEIECLTNHTNETCGCIKFSMPRLPHMKICQTYEEIECYTKAEQDFLNNEIMAEFSLDQEDFVNIKDKCDCLPPCTTIMYNIEISQADFETSQLMDILAENDYDKSYNEYHGSILTIYFKESSFLSSKRAELYGMSEFVANCGGLLGLFMGISALSLVEIFYFSTARVLTNYIRGRGKPRPAYV